MKGFSAHEIEQRLLGSVLNDPTAFGDAFSIIRNAKAFSDAKHRAIYQAMYDLYFLESTEPGILPVMGKLGKGVVDPAYLSDISILVMSGADTAYYARLVLEQWISKGVFETAEKVKRRIANGDDVFDVRDGFNEEIEEIYSQIPSDITLSMPTVVEKAMELVDSLKDKQQGILTTGLIQVDEAIGGGIPGDVIVFGGKRKSGKSTLALQAVYLNARTKGMAAAIFTREMSAAQLCLRHAMIDAKIRFIDLMTGSIDDGGLERLAATFQAVVKLPIHINEQSSGLNEILFEAKRLVRRHGVKVVVIDYLQLVEPSLDDFRANREERIASMSRALKRLARKENVIVIVLTQLNEDSKSRESRSIEQDCDKLIYIDTKEDDEEREETADNRTVDLKIVQRFGLSGNFGDVKVSYDKRYGYFKDYVPALEGKFATGRLKEVQKEIDLPF